MHNGIAEVSEDFCPSPRSPVCAASIQPVRPQTTHGCVRIQARYAGLRVGFMSRVLPRPTFLHNAASMRSFGGCTSSTADSERIHRHASTPAPEDTEYPSPADRVP